MKFPTKKLKLKTDNGAQPSSSLKKEFLEDLPGKFRNSLRGVDIALINEAFNAITNGHAKINGKKPATRSERFIVALAYFNTVRAPLQNLLLDCTVNSGINYSVDFSYNNQLHKIKFPANTTKN